jgi:peroxiredoxin
MVPADGGGNGTPAVLLFFGNWCPSCHQELPPLAAAVRAQDRAGGPLSHIRVIGVDSEDSAQSAKSFIQSSGVTFPVAADRDITVTSGLFSFEGDPYAVFVKGDGTIAKIVRGAGLTPSSFTAHERALIPSGT